MRNDLGAGDNLGKCYMKFIRFSLLSTAQLSESSLTALKEENKSLTTKVGELEGTVKKLHQDLEEEREKETAVGTDGLTRIEVARVLRERNEYKEKYLSLLEQIRYNVMCMCVHHFTTVRDLFRWVWGAEGFPIPRK